MPEIVLLSDPRIAAVPVEECGEPLVDLRDVEALRVDPRLADGAGAYAHVRLSVADLLVAAQTRLPRELRLLVVEGYRPAATQARDFASSVARHRAAHPGWDDERAAAEAAKFVSPPAVAPHVTGGAVDLTLCTAGGAELPMGTPVNATPPEAGEECRTASAAVSREARANRDLLIDAMTSAGFVNYPTEWWHWSYGERYWAFVTGARHARYGPRDRLPAGEAPVRRARGAR
ncbi:D-alanyl-D-alanine dipeptidase [Nonomuraea coxensis DSM 45129]|uniref:D-alanyl-D-alanine dipeptidase n=1 Tax=Nonomuraea coxensis DSM 45129 TaxID=1122611 RepID=A0ABX8U4S1_9ACTN|nr:M15 family metallopeptidase [Nonomuraea coxensis]QYC41637.1 D-alanyl-D-alanine dipeptidase [Nonomuraea coxensis DSM 45129]